MPNETARTVLSRETLTPLSVCAVVAFGAWSWSARLNDIEHGIRDVAQAVGRIETRLADYVTQSDFRAWIAQAKAAGAALPEYR